MTCPAVLYDQMSNLTLDNDLECHLPEGHDGDHEHRHPSHVPVTWTQEN